MPVLLIAEADLPAEAYAQTADKIGRRRSPPNRIKTDLRFYEPNATNPCNGDTFNGGQGALFTGNLVSHVTLFTNSDEVWATFTETGKVAATDDGTGVAYSGQATA